MSESIELTIDKFVFGGSALGRAADGRVAFVWNSLPGETVLADITKKKKNYIEAIATEILSSSPDRIPPLEPHYLSSSPWSIMTSEREQNEKINVAREVFTKNGNITLPQNLTIRTDEKLYGYRNKIEFSFTEKENGAISLAFFTRGGKGKIPVEKSDLAEPVINTVAGIILEWIRKSSMTTYNLKTLIVRSNGRGEAIASLFIKDELSFDDYPVCTPELKGFELYYSTHRSPASVPTKLLHRTGESSLTATLHDTKLRFGLHSFFQVNIPLFELALTDIMGYIKDTDSLLDLYSGVGSIGLPLSRKVRDCTLVEMNEEAVNFARENISLNDITNSEIICAPSEKSLDSISSNKVIIVDPPRAGLHPKVIEKLKNELPKRIIYLSCGLDTQARDIGLLSDRYSISGTTLYNFFPRTPHIESLIILDKK
jgi:23S rRNA (uracil1939-C5)-methyltransferase